MIGVHSETIPNTVLHKPQIESVHRSTRRKNETQKKDIGRFCFVAAMDCLCLCSTSISLISKTSYECGVGPLVWLFWRAIETGG